MTWGRYSRVTKLTEGRENTFNQVVYDLVIAPTPRFSTAPRKSVKSLKGLPGPQIPSLTMYAMCFGSLAPVAEAYTTRAFGSLFCNSRTVCPVFVGLPAPLGQRFLALWHSSKMMQPSKSSPHQSHGVALLTPASACQACQAPVVVGPRLTQHCTNHSIDI